jgi:OmpA-OmpF porin, OOP family
LHIQQESLPIVGQIVQLLNTDETLNISIERHTDNVGDADSNKILSNDRAKAVTDAIISKGIEKKRLLFVVW